MDIVDPSKGAGTKHFTPTGGVVPWEKVAEAKTERNRRTIVVCESAP